MSSKSKKISKEIEVKLSFENEMYTSTYGSLVICGFIFSKNRPPKKDINKKWKHYTKLLKKGEDVDLPAVDDEKFIEKTLNCFGIELPEKFPIAIVRSKINMLFLPYLCGEVYPIREDGYLPATARVGKIYPIDWDLEIEE